MKISRCIAVVAAIVFVSLGFDAGGQEAGAVRSVIVPQAWFSSFHGRSAAVKVKGVEIKVDIVDQKATTVMDVMLENSTDRPQEAELVIPVPDGAVIRGFTFEGAAKEPSTRMLTKAEAERLYHSIVAKRRDPAILEFVGYRLVKSNVFPVPANKTLKVRLTYENLLEADGNRVDFVIPRSESVEYMVPWKGKVSVKSNSPITTVYSPSHEIDLRRVSGREIIATLTEKTATEPGPFRLSYLKGGEGLTSSLYAYPDPEIGGGYFLLLAAPPPLAKDRKQSTMKRELTLVIDKSGSMSGEKIEQAKKAAAQIIESLKPGEAFNLITYNGTVSLYSEKPIAFIRSIQADGGTNLHDAIVEAVRQKPVPGMLPIVLFMTDGLPTVGKTSEIGIRQDAKKANQHKRRVFTFGVGYDVNTPLLEKIARESRGRPTFVLPTEDVEVKVSGVFKRLSGPVLSEPWLAVVHPNKRPGNPRLTDVIPSPLPDVFEGDQLVVLGKYFGSGDITLEISGDYPGKKKSFRATFDLDKATTRNGFVARLWA